MAVRATSRGAARPPFAAERADVVVAGASFAGLAVARELAGAGADVLVLDRYEIGQRATSACAVPTPWLDRMGVVRARRQEIPSMRFATPHGSTRYRLPWSWTAFDYAELCRELWAQCGAARFACAKVEGRTGAGVMTDRGEVEAELVVDALGWRRVLAAEGYQPPDDPLSRGLEVHPRGDGEEDLVAWVDRSLVRHGYAWRVPAAGEQRVGVGSYAGRDHVKEPTRELSHREDLDPERWQGNWFPHRLRAAADARTFFVGDSAGHCLPLSGEGIRTAFHFGIACGREVREVLAGDRDRAEALERYAAFSAAHARVYALLLLGQRLLPRIPPRLLTLALRGLGHPAIVRRAFTWYLDQAPPGDAAPPAPAVARYSFGA